MINVFQPDVGPEEVRAIEEVFQSKWLGPGGALDGFLLRLADHLGVQPEQLRSVSTCTEGLFQAIAALEIGPGDEVVMPSVSFVGAANAVLARGATPVFCDVDPRTLNPTEAHVAAAVTERTRAILILHYAGHPGRVDAIAEYARRSGIPLIEDAACAIGSRTAMGMCGTLGDLGTWSFDAMKILVAGDGGVVWSRDPAVAERIGRETFLGIEGPGMSRARDGGRWWVVEPVLPGRNARMNDVTAAIATVQLRRLPGFLARRARVAARYTEAFRDVDWLLPPPEPEPGTSTSWYMYWIQTRPDTRDALASYLLDRGIYTTFRYWPLHRTRLYGNGHALPGADHAASTTLLLPIHNGLSDADLETVIAMVRAFSPERRGQ